MRKAYLGLLLAPTSSSFSLLPFPLEGRRLSVIGVVALGAMTAASGILENMVGCGGPTRHTLQAGHGPRTRSGALWNKVVALGVFLLFFTHVTKALKAEQTGKAKAPSNCPQKK